MSAGYKQSEPSTSKAGPGRPKKEADPEKVAKVYYF